MTNPAENKTVLGLEGGSRETLGDEFVSAETIVSVKRTAAERNQRLALVEIAELSRENRWEDILAAFFPIEEKLPELADEGLDLPVREKVAFALGQLGRFDQAIAELQACIERDPENFRCHSSLAYTAYNSLYAAKKRQILLAGRHRAERIRLAHRHFQAAQALRPDGVTVFYREGMLWKQIEGKADRALPLFQKAVANWERLAEEEREKRHQERKNYVKALYQLASALCAVERPKAALPILEKCIAEDEQSGHLSAVHKYFALGKVHFMLNRLAEARDALQFALRFRAEEPIDFVHELLGRVFLGMNDPGKALEEVRRVPEKIRKPYVRWTESDALCALKRWDEARTVLRRALERDGRSRHKTLIRLCRLEYLLGNAEKALSCAADADRFFREQWGNPCADALFWMAVCAIKTGDWEKARSLAEELRAFRPGYEKLDLLLSKLEVALGNQRG